MLQTTRGPDIRLVYSSDSFASNFMGWASAAPSVLVSYAYFSSVTRRFKLLDIRNWQLDSGAFSAFNSGTPIKLHEYERFCAKAIASDHRLVEVIALDVIGDVKATIANTEHMWKRGIAAMPTYHIGEPFDVLQHYASSYPKVCIGGVASLPRKERHRFFSEVFARVWPCRLHGLGIGDQSLIRAFPWHSVDSASWCVQPMGYGLWKRSDKTAATNAHTVSIPARKATKQLCLRGQIEWFLRFEREMQHAWAKEMDELACLPLT